EATDRASGDDRAASHVADQWEATDRASGDDRAASHVADAVVAAVESGSRVLVVPDALNTLLERAGTGE
ncbi:MAG: hypothetical protein ABEJ23_07195, partial [Haloarculaceae archaeon]